MDRRVGCAGDSSDGSDGFDRGLNRRGWVLCLTMGCCVVLGRRGLGLAWLKRSLSWLVGVVLVLHIGR